MNKAIMISASPEKCMRIADGRQTVLLTKKKPNISTPFKVFIYETKALNHSQVVIDIDGVVGNVGIIISLSTIHRWR